MAAALVRYSYPPAHAAVAQRVYEAVTALFAAAGADAGFGAKLPGALKAAGLVDAAREIYAPIAPGRARSGYVEPVSSSRGAWLPPACSRQRRSSSSAAASLTQPPSTRLR